MGRHYHMRLKRSLLVVFLLGGITTAVTSGPLQTSSAARMHDNATVGTDLVQLDTVDGRYTQGP